ncbi:hypothetical protein [Achromobacter kerstersii]|uniref:AbiTii domain-containing protein n=1 Tax=Achromobacter kerstersii TaxID=1353890 RepID=UPI00313A80E5
MALVLELQREAISKDGSVADLLRLALVVARKLSVTEFEQWIQAELNGYKDGGVSAPTYRKITGTLKCWNPYNGWIPLHSKSPEMGSLLSSRVSGQSVGELESMREAGKSSGTYMMYFPKKLEADLMRSMEMPFQPALFISDAQIHGILDTVRNLVLDWSLKLEAAGVLGEDMTFSREEKARAAEGVMYQIENQTVIHNMTQSQVQQGTTGSTQVFQASQFDINAVMTLVKELRALLPESGLSQDEQAEVEADLTTIDAQSKSPKPRSPIIKEALRSVRTVLEGATGGAAGTALAALVVKLSQHIGG